MCACTLGAVIDNAAVVDRDLTIKPRSLGLGGLGRELVALLRLLVVQAHDAVERMAFLSRLDQHQAALAAPIAGNEASDTFDPSIFDWNSD